MVVVDYEPLTAVVHPEDALADGAAVLFDEHGDNVAIATTDPVDEQIFGDADVIVRGRYVNQRIAVAPMEPHCGSVGARSGRSTAGVRVDADAPPDAPADGAIAGHAQRRRSTSSHRTSAAASAARPACIPSRSSLPQPRSTCSGRSCGRRRAARTWWRCRTVAPRSSTSSSAVAATARSPACACTWSVTAVRIPVSVRSCRRARDGCPTASTGSAASSSTSSSPPPTPRRQVRTAVLAVPRPRHCSSGPSTTLHSSWASTRSSCAARTSSPTTCFPT